jgi:hypothetical protein
MDVMAKLHKLSERLDALSDDDRIFVTQMVSLIEKGQLPKPAEVYRICMEISVPGEEPTSEPIWTQGTVSVVYVPLEEVIWRYMPLEHLFALLWRKSLHFSPLAVMGDTSEGQLPPRAFEQTKEQLPSHIKEGRGGMDADTITAIMVEQRKRDACISCWYMNASDSLKMWREYAPNNGVAIQTTVHRLASSLIASQTPIHVGPVTYFAPDEEERYVDEALFGSLFIKHDPFRHEKELRAVAYRANLGTGVDEPVNLDMLIGRLVLSPEMKDWAVPVITEAIRRFDFNGLVEKSDLQPAQEGDTKSAATELLPAIQKPGPPSPLPPS